MLVVLDAAVLAAYVAVGAAARRAPVSMRLWWVAVGLAWWVGGVPQLRVVHQAVLVGALVWFPGRRPRRLGQYACLVAAVPVATGVVGQVGAAIVLVGVATVGTRDAFPRLAAAAVGSVQAGLWVSAQVWPGSVHPEAGLALYEVVLVAVAGGLPAGLVWHERMAASLRDRLLAGGPVGLAGLQQVLRDVLGQPGLLLDRSEAGVRLRNAGSLEFATRAAVDEAVDLVADLEQRQRALADLADELEEARARLQSTADRERARVARSLRSDLETLRHAAAAARSASIARAELKAAADDIERLVAGVPATPLGDGRLIDALRDMSARHPVPVDLIASPDLADVRGSEAAETALFFACSETLANSAKHARASRVVVEVATDDDDLVLTVTDDGVGGADPDGSGLTGLADRLAAYGGSLRVLSPPGGGTRVRARLTRSAGTA